MSIFVALSSSDLHPVHMRPRRDGITNSSMTVFLQHLQMRQLWQVANHISQETRDRSQRGHGVSLLATAHEC